MAVLYPNGFTEGHDSGGKGMKKKQKDVEKNLGQGSVGSQVEKS